MRYPQVGGEARWFLTHRRELPTTGDPGLDLVRVRALYRLTAATAGGQGLRAVFDEALGCLERLLGTSRSAILLFDDHGVMQFELWHGLSDGYRRTVAGHTPWSREARDAIPIIVPDAGAEPSLAAYGDLFAREGIRALVFVPIKFGPELLGKFMVYFDHPRRLDAAELELVETIARHVAVAVDRSRAEEAVRRSRDDLGAILAGVADAVLVEDSAGRLLYANVAAARLLGCGDAEQLLRLTHEEAMARAALRDEAGQSLPGQLLPTRIALLERRAAEGVVRSTLASTGDERWWLVKATPVCDPSSSVRFAVSVWRDITERRREELAARFLADASAVLSSSLDPATTLANVARLAVPRIADRCEIDLVGDAGHEPTRFTCACVHDRAEVLEADTAVSEPHIRVAAVLRSGVAELHAGVEDELLVATAGDPGELAQLRALSLRSLMIVPMAARGRTLGAISLASTDPRRRYGEADLRMAQDLAARAALAIDNARLFAQVRRADERKTEFLTMLAHELRNPLAPISAATELLRRGTPEARGRAIDVIDRQVRHLVRIVDDLIDVSRITRSQVELQTERLDLAALVRTTVEDHRAQAARAGLELHVDVGPGSTHVMGDTTRLAQVLGNLLQNAIKFTDPGGRLEARVTRHADQVTVSVRDTGVGMSSDLLESIFRPFVQADRSLARSRGGLGLGLVVAHGLVERHGGRMWATSEGPGLGSELSFSLPAGPERPSTPRPDDGGARAPPVAPRRVLVIEDNEDAAETLKDVLALHGHAVHVARTGPAGLDAARSVGPDLVLCDIGLPGLDGYVVAERLRAEHGPELRLVALSGYSRDEEAARARAAGFDAYCTKPVSTDELQHLLAQLPPRSPV